MNCPVCNAKKKVTPGKFPMCGHAGHKSPPSDSMFTVLIGK